jgi:hypothetical protein
LGGEPIGEPTNQAQWLVAAQPHGFGAKTATYPLEFLLRRSRTILGARRATARRLTLKG